MGTPRKAAAPRKPRNPTVEFKSGLPLGRRAQFTYDGHMWLAYPIPKFRRITGRYFRAASKAHRAQHLLSLLVARRPELYRDLRPALELLAGITNEKEPPAWRLDEHLTKKEKKS